MTTMKEYGLIFADMTVKIAEVVVNKNMFESFCTAVLLDDLRSNLEETLKKDDLHPIAIIPDTALKGGNYTETIIRNATKEESQLYLFDYENS